MDEIGSSAAWLYFSAAINLLDGDSPEENGVFFDHILVRDRGMIIHQYS